MSDINAPKAEFTHMKDGTANDWKIIAESFSQFAGGLADRIRLT